MIVVHDPFSLESWLNPFLCVKRREKREREGQERREGTEKERRKRQRKEKDEGDAEDTSQYFELPFFEIIRDTVTCLSLFRIRNDFINATMVSMFIE